jgi:hypothetical protein
MVVRSDHNCDGLLCLFPMVRFEKSNYAEIVACWSASLKWFLRCSYCVLERSV